MSALNNELQSILVQDLATGDIYDTNIDVRANYALVGPQIVYLAVAPNRPQELNQVLMHNVETNQTFRGAVLGADMSYTKTIGSAGPMAEMQLKDGKVEIQVFSAKEVAKPNTNRAPVRSELYPS